MSEYSYSYDVSLDMPDGKVHPGRLDHEIRVSEISTELSRVSTSGGTIGSNGIITGGSLEIVFESQLSSSDRTLLDGDASGPAGGLLAQHTPAAQTVKIFRYVPDTTGRDLYVAPIDLDYVIGLTTKLHAKRTIVLGEVILVEWYAEYDEDTDTFSDMVVKVEIVYTRNAMGLPLSRVVTRTWYLEDDTPASPTKVTKKFYRGNERTDELERRAKNALAAQNTLGLSCIIVDQMTNHGKTYEEAVAIGMGYASEWYNHFQLNIEEFQRTNSRLFFDAIKNLSPPTLQWAHDTPGFLTTVKAEVNFGGWT